MAQRRSRAALELAPGLRDRAHGVAVAGGQRVEQRQQAVAEAAEADDHQPRLGHERPRRQQQVDPLGDDELADEAHVAVAGEVERAQGVGGDAGVAREGALAAGVARSASSRSISAATPRGGVVARAELVDVDAGRPQARALGQAVVLHRRPQRLAGVARADEHGAGVGQALPRPGQEARRDRA